MTRRRCLHASHIERAFAEGADPTLRLHLASCARCAAVWKELEELAELGRAMPWSMPDPGELEARRTELLARAEAAAFRPRRRTVRARAVIAAAAAVALAVGAAAWLRAPPAERLHADVRPVGAARFDHHGPARDEVVRLDDGTIDLEVRPLAAGERFRVVTDDSEVEVRGTAFRVRVAERRLAEVEVAHGRVVVRSGSSASELGPGERWRSPERSAASARANPPPAVSAPPAPVASVSPPRRPSRGPAADPPPSRADPARLGKAAAAPAPSAPPPSAAERAFDDGWRALRNADYGTAAERFQSAEATAGGDPIAEDAAYWSAVALARAARSDQAARAMRRFLDRYPRSPRAAEGASILGWLRLAAHDLDDAERCFRAYPDDPDPRVRESARRGLAEVAAARR